MTPFPLKVVSPDGMEFEGMVEELVVRSTTGDIGIMAGHAPCVAPLGMGRATGIVDGKKRYAACIGGMLSVTKDGGTLVPTTFEFAEDIDSVRVEASYQRAKAILDNKNASDTDIKLAEARLRRALVRRSVISTK